VVLAAVKSTVSFPAVATINCAARQCFMCHGEDLRHCLKQSHAAALYTLVLLDEHYSTVLRCRNDTRKALRVRGYERSTCSGINCTHNVREPSKGCLVMWRRQQWASADIVLAAVSCVGCTQPAVDSHAGIKRSSSQYSARFGRA
jgi:hypothetical protein